MHEDPCTHLCVHATVVTNSCSKLTLISVAIFTVLQKENNSKYMRIEIDT